MKQLVVVADDERANGGELPVLHPRVSPCTAIAATYSRVTRNPC